MNPPGCPNERAVAAAGELPVDLRAHCEACAECRDARLVALSLRALTMDAPDETDATLQARRIWIRAQLRSEQRARAVHRRLSLIGGGLVLLAAIVLGAGRLWFSGAAAGSGSSPAPVVFLLSAAGLYAWASSARERETA